MLLAKEVLLLRKEEIDKLSGEKMKLLTKVNNLLEEMLEETDVDVRNATSELIRQLKSNISEIEQKIEMLEQEEDVSEENTEVEQENNSEGNEESEEDSGEGDEGEIEYTDEPNISIGRSDDGVVLAVYDKRKKKQR